MAVLKRYWLWLEDGEKAQKLWIQQKYQIHQQIISGVWTPGLYLKFITEEHCLTNSFQQNLSNFKGVIVIGVSTAPFEFSKAMFELSQSMEWTRLEQTLKIEHFAPLAVPIPDELVSKQD